MKEIAQIIEAIIASADNDFIKVINATQSDLYSKLLKLFNGLEIDSEGYILNNQANRSLFIKASQEFNRAIKQSDYKNGVNDFADATEKINLANENYFSSISNSFVPNRAFITSLQNQTVKNIETLLLNDGLNSQIKQPLMNIIQQNINSGGSYSGFLEQLRENIIGMKNEGKLMHYSRTIMNDALFNYSRAYQQSVTEDLGLEFYYYAGGLVKDSREFCMEHSDQFYHQKEVEEWASEDWQGKRPDTTESSIFIFAGGWNCRHSIIPVDILIVPKDVIDRNIESGNYNPDGKF